MKRRALVMTVAATFLWAGSYILNKLAFLGGIGPLTLSGLRNFLVSMILFAIRKGEIEKQAPPLAPRVIVLLGTLGKTIAQGLQYVGQSYLTPTQSSLFCVGNTAFVILVDMLWLRENQTRWDLVKFLFLILGISL